MGRSEPGLRCRAPRESTGSSASTRLSSVLTSRLARGDTSSTSPLLLVQVDVTTDQPLGSICACAQARGEGRRRRAGDAWAFIHALPRAPRKKGGEGVPWALAAHRGFGTCCALLVGCRAVNVFTNGAGVALGWILLGKHSGKGEDVVLESGRAVPWHQRGAVGAPGMPPPRPAWHQHPGPTARGGAVLVGSRRNIFS